MILTNDIGIIGSLSDDWYIALGPGSNYNWNDLERYSGK